jgi:hypothetical protein
MIGGSSSLFDSTLISWISAALAWTIGLFIKSFKVGSDFCLDLLRFVGERWVQACCFDLPLVAANAVDASGSTLVTHALRSGVVIGKSPLKKITRFGLNDEQEIVSTTGNWTSEALKAVSLAELFVPPCCFKFSCKK